MREDKLRESGDGFDGTWVAHPDLVPIAMEVFDEVLGDRPNQLERLRDDVEVDRRRSSSTSRSRAARSPRTACAPTSRSACCYLDAWLHGTGAAAIDNLMEDVATAEIARSQVWSWVKAGEFDADDWCAASSTQIEAGDEAKRLFAEVALADELPEFLTLSAYPRLRDA